MCTVVVFKKKKRLGCEHGAINGRVAGTGPNPSNGLSLATNCQHVRGRVAFALHGSGATRAVISGALGNLGHGKCASLNPAPSSDHYATMPPSTSNNFARSARFDATVLPP
jgi:hypothetical protein